MPKKVGSKIRMADLFFGPESLTRQLSVAQAEAAFAVRLEGFGPDPILCVLNGSDSRPRFVQVMNSGNLRGIGREVTTFGELS